MSKPDEFSRSMATEYQRGYEDGLAAAESQREALDVGRIEMALKMRGDAGFISGVTYRELAEAIVAADAAALKEQP